MRINNVNWYELIWREYLFQKKTKSPEQISCSEILYFLNSPNLQSVQFLTICY